MSTAIGTGKFRSSINALENILVHADLWSERNDVPNYKGCTASHMRRLDYSTQWAECIRNGWYDIKLGDESVFQFRDPSSPCYAFFEVPFEVTTFEGFVKDSYGAEVTEFSVDEMYELQADFQAFVDAEEALRGFTPIRYDYDPGAYIPGRHPASHVHLGHDRPIRISVEHILTPLSFGLFVLRQIYPDRWRELLDSGTIDPHFGEIRDNLSTVPATMWQDFDMYELYLR